MGAVVPVIVVVLALVAAGSIAYVAWQLTSKDVQDQLERSLGQPGAADPHSPQEAPAPAASDSPAGPQVPGEDSALVRRQV